MRLFDGCKPTAVFNFAVFNLVIALFAFSLPVFAADAGKTKAAAAPVPPYEAVQPTTENIDLGMYARIREEGLTHSHIMEYASALSDDIGPRLTGSPNMAKANAWTRDQLAAMGCVNAHLEDWGEFGMGWQQLNTWVRMTEPDTAVFVAQATPWSPSTNGPMTAQAASVVIEDEKDIAKYKGKLAGKIVLLGALRDVPVPDKPFFTRYSDADLKNLESLPIKSDDRDARV